MIQIAAMFQEVAPVATMPTGGGTATGPLPASPKGAFAKVLQGARSGEAAAEDAAPKSATSDSAAVDAQGLVQSTDVAKVRQLTGESAGKEALVAKPDQAKGSVLLSELQGAILAAEALQGTPFADAAQSGAAMATAAAGTSAQTSADGRPALSGAATLGAVVPAHAGRAIGQELSRPASLHTAQELIPAPASPQAVAAVATTGSNAQQESGAVAASADTVRTRPTLAWSAARGERAVPAHAGTVADDGQEVSRLASLQVADEKNPVPASPQAAQRPAAQDAAAAIGNNAQQQTGAAVAEARPGAATAVGVPEQGTGEVASPPEAVQLRQARAWPAAETQRPEPAQAGTAAGKGQEVSTLASLQKAEEHAAGNGRPDPAQPGAAADKGLEVSRLASLQKTQAPATGKEGPDPAQAGTAAAKGQEVSKLASLQKAEVKDVAPASQQAAQRPAAQEVTAATASSARQEGAAAPVARPGAAAGGFVPTPVQGASFQAELATPASNTARAASLPAVDTQSAGAPSEVEGAKVAMLGEARRTGTATGPTEGAQREVPAAGGKTQGQAPTGPVAQQQPVQAATARADATPSPEKATQPADGRYAKAAQGAESPQAAANEQAGVAPKASAEEASGTKTASALTARLAPSQGNSGQDLSGDAGKQGHPGQKAPSEQNGQLQPALTGAQTPAAAEAAQPEMKQASHRSALHENILSQVKDGAVSHDGKGNGQMSIKLNPGELGELKIQVRMEDNRLRIEVQADNRMVKDLLMSNLESLKEALTSKNFTMAGFDVSTGGGGFNSPLPEEKRSSRQQPMRTARAGGYPGQEERRVNYLTGDVNNLLDVRF